MKDECLICKAPLEYLNEVRVVRVLNCGPYTVMQAVQ